MFSCNESGFNVAGSVLVLSLSTDGENLSCRWTILYIAFNHNFVWPVVSQLFPFRDCLLNLRPLRFCFCAIANG